MPLGTLDRSPPPFFRQGPSALSKLLVFSALALFLMVADVRLKLSMPIRTAVAAVLMPMQWAVLRPLDMLRGGGDYFTSLSSAQRAQQDAEKRLAAQSLRATQVEQLQLENDRLRQLLTLKERINTPAQAAQVLYERADPYTRRVMVDKGRLQQVKLGSPVMDETGILGQVTRVYPMSSEVTLLIDRDHTMSVLNTRTGVRSIVYGAPATYGGALELRFMAANADVQPGDLLVTSGVDAVYPPGIPVARVRAIDRRVDSAFAKMDALPLAQVQGAKHVMLLEPVVLPNELPAQIEPTTSAPKKGAKK